MSATLYLVETSGGEPDERLIEEMTRSEFLASLRYDPCARIVGLADVECRVCGEAFSPAFPEAAEAGVCTECEVSL